MKWPEGCRSSGGSCGIKQDGPDVGLLVFDEPVQWAGVFTRNAAAAAPVRWSRDLRGIPARALVVNSGNANACTGAAGERAVLEVVAAAARSLGCEHEQILVASTGPIGRLLPAPLICDALPDLASDADANAEPFATSILTTDTKIKSAETAGPGFSVAGVAKGAAMIAPNMATMLGFLVTDARVDDEVLHRILSGAADRTFNRISVDGCESTNDSVFLFATGRGARAEAADLAQAVTAVCSSLAEQIVSDAEGGTKVLRITVTGARDEDGAARLGRAVADSALWRAAAHGGDANWGRILSALGSCDRTLDVTQVTLRLGGAIVFSKGEPGGSVDPSVMSGREIAVECRVGSGDGRATILAADLSCEYVRLNATGTS